MRKIRYQYEQIADSRQPREKLGCKKPCGKITYLWSVVLPYKRGPQTANLTARPWLRDFSVDVCSSPKMTKKLNRKISIIIHCRTVGSQLGVFSLIS